MDGLQWKEERIDRHVFEGFKCGSEFARERTVHIGKDSKLSFTVARKQSLPLYPAVKNQKRFFSDL